jgi:small subunit ribosomal protein S8
MSDPIADMLTRIRNATRALLPEVRLPHSNVKENLARLLQREGYIEACAVEGKTAGKTAKHKQITLRLKYQGRKGIITGLRRVSRPGLRRYVAATDIPAVLGGLGTAVLSTPRGILSGREARKQNVGGELICFVW